ncbi:hypothetical protein [Streptomyces sp. NPDC058247]|uniref:hypothetical protein n=1 Tax=Streptomyces sp. NPDC058247 TaxID=3346401 RepID=UPI0036E9D5CE
MRPEVHSYAGVPGRGAGSRSPRTRADACSCADDEGSAVVGSGVGGVGVSGVGVGVSAVRVGVGRDGGVVRPLPEGFAGPVAPLEGLADEDASPEAASDAVSPGPGDDEPSAPSRPPACSSPPPGTTAPPSGAARPPCRPAECDGAGPPPSWATLMQPVVAAVTATTTAASRTRRAG